MVGVGRGRGGTVCRLVDDVGDPLVYERERELYEPIRSVLADEWAKDHDIEPLAVEITASQGRRATGGTWTRPDITCVDVRTYYYLPGLHVDVTTFEVKPLSALNVQAVYEALAHRRAATKAYVLVHTPEGEETDGIADVTDVAAAHGIGLIAAGRPRDYDTWEERVAPVRTLPDPAQLDDFIRTQLSRSAQETVAQRVRGYR